MNNIDLDQLARLGRLTQGQCQELHTILCNQAGLVDGDAVIAEWNRHSPDLLWSNAPTEDAVGQHVMKMSDLIIQYMKEKLKS